MGPRKTLKKCELVLFHVMISRESFISFPFHMYTWLCWKMGFNWCIRFNHLVVGTWTAVLRRILKLHPVSAKEITNVALAESAVSEAIRCPIVSCPAACPAVRFFLYLCPSPPLTLCLCLRHPGPWMGCPANSCAVESGVHVNRNFLRLFFLWRKQSPQVLVLRMLLAQWGIFLEKLHSFSSSSLVCCEPRGSGI